MIDPKFEQELDDIAHPRQDELKAARKAAENEVLSQGFFMIASLVALCAVGFLWLMSQL